MLNPRSIAMQGLGFGLRMTALQGLVPVTESSLTDQGGGAFEQFARSKRSRKIEEQNRLIMCLIAAAVSSGVIK